MSKPEHAAHARWLIAASWGLVAALLLVVTGGLRPATAAGVYGYDNEMNVYDNHANLVLRTDADARGSGAVERRVADPSGPSLASSGELLAPQTTLYRSVSTAEADDIARFGGFRAGPNSYEGKLFATSAEDAARYGRINDALTPGGSPFHIVETRVPTSLANTFERMTLDSMQAVHVAEGQLGALNAAGRWRTWDWVPWVGKPGSGL